MRQKLIIGSIALTSLILVVPLLIYDRPATGSMVLVISTFIFIGLLISAGIKEFIKERKFESKKRNFFRKFNKDNGYQGTTIKVIENTGSFSAGISDVVSSGFLKNSGNAFSLYYQFEQRESTLMRDQHVEYKRTVLQVEIPNIKTQFILNSKLNNADNHGENLNKYKYSQKLITSESIYKYVDMLTPRNDEVNFLVLLSPDVIGLILRDFVDADIELVDDQLYVYFYKYLDPEDASTYISKLDGLLQKMKLRSTDLRTPIQLLSGGQVARIAVLKQQSRKLKTLLGMHMRLLVVSLLLPFLLIWPSPNLTFSSNYLVMVLVTLFLLHVFKYFIRFVIQENLKYRIKRDISTI